MSQLAQTIDNSLASVGIAVLSDQPKGKRGRPRLSTAEKVAESTVRELARASAPGVISRLILLSKGNTMVAVRACEVLLERGFGKPKQQIEISPLAELTDEQVEMRYFQLQQQLAQEQAALPSLERVDGPALIAGDPLGITK